MIERLEIELCGERLWLDPERAVVWPARSTVIVADTHFGKSAIFGQHGIAVPDGSDAHDLARLQRLLETSQATRLLILGDFLHGAVQADSGTAGQLTAWLGGLGSVRVHVVAGNHDRRVLQLWRPPVEWEPHELRDGPFRFVHEAASRVGQSGVASDSAHAYSFSGHVHPVLRIGRPRRRAARVPVFWAGSQGMVLPSFGVFTGGALIHPEPDEQVYVVGPERVVRWRAV